MGSHEKSRKDLESEISELRAQLAESQETLRAIRQGEVDALVVFTSEGERIFTLQSADQIYRTIIEQMQDGAVTLAEDGRISYSNRRFAEMVKRPLEEIIGSHVREYVVESDQGCLDQLIRQGFGGSAHGEVMLRASDAALTPIHVGISLVVLDGRSSICMVVGDLTERKRAETVLASAEFTRRLIDSAPIGVAVVGRDLRYVLANPTYQMIADVPMVGRTIAEVFPPAVAQIVQPSLQRVLDSGQAIEFQEYETPIRGRIWWNVSAIPLRDAAGNSEAVLILAQDVTERKLAEKALARLAAIVESSDDAILSKNLDGIIQTWNAGAERLFGYRAEEVVGQPITLLLPAERMHEEGQILAQVRSGGRVERLETMRVTKDGRRLEVSVTVSPVKDQDGRIIAASTIAHDITGRKRAEEALKGAKEQAEAASLTKSQFLANMSHELRTPMNAILGMIGLALPKATNSTVKDCLETAKGSADLLLMLLNDLLDSARIESGKLELESAPFSLRRMLDQVTRVLSVRARAKGLSFYCRIADDTPIAVVGDRLRLQQVLLNLAGNAIKFTSKGEVVVRVEGPRSSVLGLSSSLEPSPNRDSSPEIQDPRPGVPCAPKTQDPICHLQFSISDTGIGIPPSVQERLFQPFVQADASMARRFGGTGLGLSISKSLVEMMDGRIWVESEQGRGSTFYFTVRLPLAKAVPLDFEAPVAAPAAASAQLRILLVEDNPANQKLATYLLQDRGHVVETATSGQEAIELTEKNRYDVILMDVEMPDMNGLEATAAIRGREAGGPSAPIIAMTAHAMKGDRDRCLAAGMNAYLSKPINANEMVALVESLAERRGGIEEREIDQGEPPAAPRSESLNPPPAISVVDPELALKRRVAEQRLRTGKAQPALAVSEVDARALVHELQVYHIELEMQNEELHRAQTAAEEASAKYCDLFDFAPVAYFLWDQQGRIIEANLAGAALLGLDRNAVIDKRFGQFVTIEYRARFADFCRRVVLTDAKQTCEVKILKDARTVDALVEGIATQDLQEHKRLCRAAVIDISQHKRGDESAGANLRNGLQPSSAAAATSTAPSRLLQVLLAEDTPMNQMLVSRVLSKRGHTVEVVEDGRQLLGAVGRKDFDVVLMDVQMPVMDGFQATRTIRKLTDPKKARLPVIAITAESLKGDRERCLAAGMDGYLSKPINSHEMIALVETLAAETTQAASQQASPETASSRPAVVFDPQLAMERCSNQPKMAQEMIECFFDEVDSLFPQMRRALGKGDLQEVGRLGHRLVGTVVYLGSEVATEAARAVENIAFHGGTPAEAEEAIDALEHECTVLKAALRQHLLPAERK